MAVMTKNLRRALRERRLEDAAEILERLKVEEPLSVLTRGGELELLLLSGRLEEAQALATQLVESFPDSARVLYLAGRVAYGRKQYQQAIPLLKESLRVTPHWRTRHWLGKTYTQSGRFSEAEAILTEIVTEHPHAGSDLGWLYERMGDEERAITVLETFLQSYPDNSYVEQQIQRLRARTLGDEGLRDEVESLLELGEELPPDLAPDYIRSLLTTGQSRRARDLITDIENTLDDRTATRIAWECRKLQAYDLAYRLFVRTLPHNIGSHKFLAALERDAARAGRIGELIELYRAHANDHKNLWGRIRRLASRASD